MHLVAALALFFVGAGAQGNGCCHAWGFGDLMRKCCDTFVNTTKDDCARAHPGQPDGGGWEWLVLPCGSESVGNNIGGVETAGQSHVWHLSVQGIAGITVGAVVFVALVLAIALAFLESRRRVPPDGGQTDIALEQR